MAFADAGVLERHTVEDGISLAFDQYLVGTLTVTKTAAVISDGFTSNPLSSRSPFRAPILEYTITVQNDGLVTSVRR